MQKISEGDKYEVLLSNPIRCRYWVVEWAYSNFPYDANTTTSNFRAVLGFNRAAWDWLHIQKSTAESNK